MAAGEAARQRPNVAYFPSFEIITGHYNHGRYFAPDLRSVTEEGVSHVMRVFLRHYTEGTPRPSRTRRTGKGRTHRTDDSPGQGRVRGGNPGTSRFLALSFSLSPFWEKAGVRAEHARGQPI